MDAQGQAKVLFEYLLNVKEENGHTRIQKYKLNRPDASFLGNVKHVFSHFGSV